MCDNNIYDDDDYIICQYSMGISDDYDVSNTMMTSGGGIRNNPMDGYSMRQAYDSPYNNTVRYI